MSGESNLEYCPFCEKSVEDVLKHVQTSCKEVSDHFGAGKEYWGYV